jgi:type IV pilus assembly protein PilE
VKKILGITLIELMIVVVISGIIAAIALPAYQNQLRDSRRQDGMKALLQLKIQQEEFRLNNNSYATAIELNLPPNDFYIFSVSNVSASTYTLTATAKGSQTSDTGCTIITLDQSMNKFPVQCW